MAGLPKLLETVGALLPQVRKGQRVYHGTARTFDELKVPTVESGYVMDRGLGTHVAPDPEIANYAATKDVTNDPWSGMKFTGNPQVRPYRLPDETKLLEVPQQRYGSGALEVDQFAVERMMARDVYRKNPEMLSRYLQQARNVPQQRADDLAARMARGETVQLENEPYTLDRFVGNFGGRPYNAADRQAMVDAARAAWQDQGYAGLKYINTSPMETEKAKDLSSYIIFDPKTLQYGIPSAAMGLLGLGAYQPQGQR